MNRRKQVKALIVVLAAGLFLSGVTAIPLEWELGLLNKWFDNGWIDQVNDAVVYTNQEMPFMAYGTDWLAFAHVILAILVIGTFRRPEEHRWIFQFGMIASVLILPVAGFFGELRGIPWGWRLIDMSFALVAFPMFWYVERWVKSVRVNDAREILQI